MVSDWRMLARIKGSSTHFTSKHFPLNLNQYPVGGLIVEVAGDSADVLTTAKLVPECQGCLTH
jgi:hypothetical protein